MSSSSERSTAPDLIIDLPGLRSVYTRAVEVAAATSGASLSNILIRGELGVGKGTMARWIHRHSPRAAFTVIGMPCDVAELDDWLFGQSGNLFKEVRIGGLERARRGTLVLGEVCELVPFTQEKLLRILQVGKIRRPGGLIGRPFDARLISTTSGDVEGPLASGEFSRELHAKLCSHTLTIPPLRERRQDIEPLTRHFLAQAGSPYTRKIPDVSREVIDLFNTATWPGNALQLGRVLRRALLHLAAGGQISIDLFDAEGLLADRLPINWTAYDPRVPGELGRLTSNELGERSAIEQALRGYGATGAAAVLGISRRVLIGKIAQYRIQHPRKTPKAPM